MRELECGAKCHYNYAHGGVRATPLSRELPPVASTTSDRKNKLALNEETIEGATSRRPSRETLRAAGPRAARGAAARSEVGIMNQNDK